MNWIKIDGSLGEQMLRYALALSLSKKGENIGAIVPDQSLFNTFPALPKLPLKHMTLAQRIGKYIGCNSNTESKDFFSYTPVESLGDDANSFFTLSPKMIPDEFATITSKLQGDNVVAVHVPTSDIGVCRCTPDYYNWAIAGMKQWLGDALFVIITDDLKTAQRWIIHPDNVNAVWIHLPQRHHKYIFHLLQRAAHCITSGTLESWWGAWLNKNTDKIVVVPKSNVLNRLSPLYWTIIPTT
ncbi:MAG: hypothetical protein ACI4UN_02295 [Muribaculaceae bacterium]